MARVKLNPIFDLVQGTIGDMVVKKYGKKLVLSRKPVFVNRKFSTAQKQNQRRFAEAMAYAKLLMKDQQKRKPYETAAAETGKRILSLMVAEYLRTHPK